MLSHRVAHVCRKTAAEKCHRASLSRRLFTVTSCPLVRSSAATTTTSSTSPSSVSPEDVQRVLDVGISTTAVDLKELKAIKTLRFAKQFHLFQREYDRPLLQKVDEVRNNQVAMEKAAKKAVRQEQHKDGSISELKEIELWLKRKMSHASRYDQYARKRALEKFDEIVSADNYEEYAEEDSATVSTDDPQHVVMNARKEAEALKIKKEAEESVAASADDGGDGESEVKSPAELERAEKAEAADEDDIVTLLRESDESFEREVRRRLRSSLRSQGKEVDTAEEERDLAAEEAYQKKQNSNKQGDRAEIAKAMGVPVDGVRNDGLDAFQAPTDNVVDPAEVRYLETYPTEKQIRYVPNNDFIASTLGEYGLKADLQLATTLDSTDQEDIDNLRRLRLEYRAESELQKQSAEQALEIKEVEYLEPGYVKWQKTYTERKVILRLNVQHLNLPSDVLSRLEGLSGGRYNPSTNILRIAADKYANRHNNFLYGKMLIKEIGRASCRERV
eukprot:TRINITY_DN4419_c0_g1_i1.p1 TRINITY_DN4419_c0_g1~~TRINITY_DN4419_c0_g1_i1.p1  ORF type:complete len:503 (+),score=148.68 TRINITY_DN4419_c0_g1_i1:168-1676(+)